MTRNRFAKRHYEAIATAIQEARRRTNGSNDPIAVVVDELADAFASDNACSNVTGSCVRASQEQMSGRGANNDGDILRGANRDRG
jgi:hypothetical protein